MLYATLGNAINGFICLHFTLNFTPLALKCDRVSVEVMSRSFFMHTVLKLPQVLRDFFQRCLTDYKRRAEY